MMGNQYSHFDPYIFQYMYENDQKNWEIMNQGRLPGVPLNYGSYPPSAYYQHQQYPGYMIQHGGMPYSYPGAYYGGYGYASMMPQHFPQAGGHRPARLAGTLPYSYPPIDYKYQYSNY